MKLIMKKITICSDIICGQIGSNYSQLENYDFKLFLTERDFVIIEYPKEDLNMLKDRVAVEIEKCLAKRNTIPR